jgi:hypothetical protein
MRPPLTNALWMLAPVCASLGLAIVVLVCLGAGERGTDVALRLTARLSFLLFWLAYTGGALTVLFGSTFLLLKRHARDFGLAFAFAHLSHVGLVIWLCSIGPAPSMSTFVFFGIALVFTYALAFFSIGRMQGMLGARSWWLLRTIGLNYIAFAFAKDFAKDPLGGGLTHVAEYLPFIVLAVAAPLLRLLALTVHVLQPQKISWS